MLILQRDDYWAIGVQTKETGERLWVLLNPKYRLYVKAVPDHAVRLAKPEPDELQQRYGLHPEVADFLSGERISGGLNL